VIAAAVLLATQAVFKLTRLAGAAHG
jgi:hypothetical protein